MLDLPRSIQLALWLPHARSTAALERAAAVVQHADEPHTVAGDDGAPGPGLLDLLAAWGGVVQQVAAVLPVPGDVVGVPATVSAAAVDAGECLLVTTPAGSFAAVPQIEEFGSAAEPGHLVEWRVAPVAPWCESRCAPIMTTSSFSRGSVPGISAMTLKPFGVVSS